MGIMSKILEKLGRRKAKYAEMDEDYRLQKTLSDRQKNANERELEGYLEEERQKKIKAELDYFRKKKMNDFYHGHSVLKDKKLFTGNKNIFKNSDKLTQGNLYQNEKRLFLKT